VIDIIESGDSVQIITSSDEAVTVVGVSKADVEANPDKYLDAHGIEHS